ncbi:MAG: DUF1501 domain-containing protein, partial [Campylobacterota bacterium]|nr:DUF1501 domain-containing protein [Campylobacterota bacterium]
MNNNLNRRDFLKLVGNSSMAVVLSSYLAPVKLMANDGSGLDDFKALVVIQMGGGNDGLSMFVPTEKTDYEQYTKARTEELRIKKNNMMGNLRANREGKYTDYTENMNFLNLGIGENNFYIPDGKNSATSIYTKGYYLHDKHFDSKIATNGLMPELANILDQGNGAVIQNVGNAKKIYKKENLGKDSGNLPPFGGSHDEQTILIETGQATNIYHDTGWMGRLADEWKNLDIRSQHGMNINLSSFGAKRMMQGKTTTSFNMSYEGPTDFRRLNKSAYQEIANIERRDIFKNLFNSSRQDTYDNLNDILKDWETV